MTASISFSSHANAGVCQNRFGSCVMSSTAFESSLASSPPFVFPPPEDADDDEEEGGCSTLDGSKWGPDLKTSWKWSNDCATSFGAAGCGCGVCGSAVNCGCGRQTNVRRGQGAKIREPGQNARKASFSVEEKDKQITRLTGSGLAVTFWELDHGLVHPRTTDYCSQHLLLFPTLCATSGPSTKQV